ncbi:NADH:flavin oxidoreductase [Tardibacter chloracetimidivorans]|uniref:NADH:flavin oxidoreductase n=1 Tax=Tardibacter chloracetimidivorans TaxID=1921510 RepID=A0A1L3ZWA4_9SPHN|nr:FAD-dependent oxidoreductase [Tardibacter chloracetimidivorans]API59911.1 NADH:flavin oxidoreductase [Tardibacter chloracetimidivorans]
MAQSNDPVFRTEGPFPHLFSPLTLRGLTLPNRVVMAPMSSQLGNRDGTVTDRQIAFYRERAAGGVGMIVVEFCCVDRATGLSEHRQLSIETPAHIESHRHLTDAIRNEGTVACLQLQHGGQAAKLDTIFDGVARAPSDVSRRSDPSRLIARAFTDDELERLVDAFGAAAIAGMDAGYQAIEFHGAHGYVLSAFLSPLTNRRDDRWGGDEDRRLELPRRVIERVREAIGERPLLYRISADEFSRGGLTIEDMERITPKLVAAGLDGIHVSTGLGWTGMHNVIEPMSQPEGWRLPYSRRIREATGVPVITVGQIRSPVTAERALSEGDADLIALGRPLLADPHWAAKAKAGRAVDIRPCTSCNYCVSVSLTPDGTICCAENPRTSRELDPLPRAEGHHKAVVVGAGPGGLAAALLLDQAGYDTRLIEERSAVGGGLIASAAPPHKEMLNWHRDYLSRRIAGSGVTLDLGKAETADMIAAGQPRLVVLATGSRARPMPFEGHDDALVHDAYALLMGDDRWIDSLGEGPVLVYGGGETGCETAEMIAARGRSVLLVTRSPLKSLARSAEFIYRTVLLKRLTANPLIEILTDTELVAVHDGEARLCSAGEGAARRLVSAVLIAQGREPNDALLDALTGLGIEAVPIGDAVKGGRIGDAIHGAYAAVRSVTMLDAEPEELAC